VTTTHEHLSTLYWAWVGADAHWSHLIETTYPKSWSAHTRYIEKGEGEEGTPLRAAFAAMMVAKVAFHLAGGEDWLMGRHQSNQAQSNQAQAQRAAS
jgi:hypothetical protein